MQSPIQVGPGQIAAVTYTVERGDTLSKIAAEYGLEWRQVFGANRDRIDHPDLIFPGQVFTIPAADFVPEPYDYHAMF